MNHIHHHRPESLADLESMFPDAKRCGNYLLMRCPCHDDKSPSLKLRMNDDKGLPTWHCFAGCEWKAIGQELGLLSTTRNISPVVRPQVTRTYGQNLAPLAAKLWRQGRAVTGKNAAGLYLLSRGIKKKSKELRYHPALAYFERTPDGKPKQVGAYPSLIAAIRDLDGDIVALQRSYLTPEGNKISGQDHRRMLGSFRGESVHLDQPNNAGELLVGEGLETALAASTIFDLPAWAALTANNLGALLVPDGLKRLYIAVDNDPAGRAESEKLKRRAEEAGSEVIKLEAGGVIDRPGADWADVLRRQSNGNR